MCAPGAFDLAWAIRQAILTGSVVDAVTAWEYPATSGYAFPAVDDVDFEKIATQVLTEAIADVAEAYEPVTITTTVVHDNPARALLNASAGASLLVVGSRGHGGFVEALLGSVGQHCVQHATCPVVVIRAGG
jgi:nucleotide-binding universal stress UspA family protein